MPSLAAYSQMETSSHKVLGNSCVNLRAEPSINATVIKCLQSGTDVQIIRIPPTGKFAWVNDQAGHIWYMALVPGTNTTGWILPDCTDIFDNTDIKECTDFGYKGLKSLKEIHRGLYIDLSKLETGNYSDSKNLKK